MLDNPQCPIGPGQCLLQGHPARYVPEYVLGVHGQKPILFEEVDHKFLFLDSLEWRRLEYLIKFGFGFGWLDFEAFQDCVDGAGQGHLD